MNNIKNTETDVIELNELNKLNKLIKLIENSNTDFKNGNFITLFDKYKQNSYFINNRGTKKIIINQITRILRTLYQAHQINLNPNTRQIDSEYVLIDCVLCYIKTLLELVIPIDQDNKETYDIYLQFANNEMKNHELINKQLPEMDLNTKNCKGSTDETKTHINSYNILLSQLKGKKQSIEKFSNFISEVNKINDYIITNFKPYTRRNKIVSDDYYCIMEFNKYFVQLYNKSTKIQNLIKLINSITDTNKSIFVEDNDYFKTFNNLYNCYNKLNYTLFIDKFKNYVNLQNKINNALSIFIEGLFTSLQLNIKFFDENSTKINTKINIYNRQKENTTPIYILDNNDNIIEEPVEEKNSIANLQTQLETLIITIYNKLQILNAFKKMIVTINFNDKKLETNYENFDLFTNFTKFSVLSYNIINKPFNDAIDSELDLFTMVTNTSNREMLINNTHYINISMIYDAIITDMFTQPPKLILTNVTEQKTNETTSQEIIFNTSSTSEVGRQKGGAGEDCNGEMIKTDAPNELYESFLKCGIKKTYEELSHDFRLPDQLGPYLYILKPIYQKFIAKRILYKPTTSEMKINRFITSLDVVSPMVDSEWSYYNKTLQYYDDECNNLEKLTIIKIANTDRYAKFKPVLPEYKIEIEEEDKKTPGSKKTKEYVFSTIDNLPVSPIFSMADIQTFVTDNPTSKIKLYPLVSDAPDSGNFVSNKKITDSMNIEFLKNMYEIKYAPGLIDPACTGPYAELTFTKDINVPVNNPVVLRINKIQALENINSPLAFNARVFLIEGINAFMGYFGVPQDKCIQKLVVPNELETRRTYYLHKDEVNNNLLDDATNPDPNMAIISFSKILDPAVPSKFNGINFKLTTTTTAPASIQIELRFGDYNIPNICNFVKKYKGIIPYIFSEPNDNTPSHIRLHKFAKAIYDRIDETFLNSVIGTDTTQITQDQLLTEIIISIKSFGDSLQVYYAKRLQNLYPEMYISSSDKNVGAESLLLDSNFILNGTGIRPHLSFFNEKLNFFGEQSFLNILKGDTSVPGETEYDTCLTITTNIGLLNEEKLWDSIITSILKLQLPTFTFVETVFKENKLAYILTILPTMVGLNDDGFNKMIQLFTELGENYKELNLPANTEENKKSATKMLITKLSDIDAFLKKTIDIITISSDDGKVLTNKLDIITEFVNTKFIPYLAILSTSKYDVRTKQTPTDTMLKNVKTNIQNILPSNFIDFSTKYMNNDIKTIINNTNTKYKQIIDISITSIQNTITQFDNITSKYVTPVKREKEERTISTIKQTLDFINPAFLNPKGEIDKTLSELTKKLDKTKTQLTELINKFDPGNKTKPETFFDKAKSLLGLKPKDDAAINSAMNKVTGALQKVEEQKKKLIESASDKAKKNTETMSVEPARSLVKDMLTNMNTFVDTLIKSTTKGGKTMKKRNKYKMNKTIKYNKYKKNKNDKRSFKKQVKRKRKRTRR
jgi:hypothetical protein